MKKVVVFLLLMVFWFDGVFANKKISPLLESRLSNSESIRVIIKIKKPAIIRAGGNNVILNKQNIARTSQQEILNILTTRNNDNKVKSFWIVNAVAATLTPDMIKRIAERPEVENIIPNIKLHLLNENNNLPYTRSADAYNLDIMRVKEVWKEFNIDGSGVKVGVVDSGLNTNLGFTDGKFVEGKNFVGDTVSDDITDGNGHGTHVSGTVIGGHVSGPLYEMNWFWPVQVGDFDGRIGVAPGAKLYFAKVMGNDGSGSFEDILEGMQWLADPDNNPNTKDGVRVINASLGASRPVPEMRPYIKEIRETGVILVVAAGNSGKKVGSPADFPEVITIGATDINDNKASFSSIGPSEYDGKKIIKPDLCAPGVKIVSYYKDKLMKLDGTSMASPNVCGVVALMLQADPTLTQEKVLKILRKTAIDLGENGPDNYFGWGRVDAYKAVKALLNSKNDILESQLNTLKVLNNDVKNALSKIKNNKISDKKYMNIIDNRNRFIDNFIKYINKNNINTNTILDLINTSKDLSELKPVVIEIINELNTRKVQIELTQ